jgi:PAS domain-containing protein
LNPADSDLAGHLLGLLSAQSRALAVILLDNEGKIVGWLAGAGEIFGYE